MQSSYEKCKVKKTKKLNDSFSDIQEDILKKKKQKNRQIKNFKKITDYLTEEYQE